MAFTIRYEWLSYPPLFSYMVLEALVIMVLQASFSPPFSCCLPAVLLEGIQQRHNVIYSIQSVRLEPARSQGMVAFCFAFVSVEC